MVLLTIILIIVFVSKQKDPYAKYLTRKKTAKLESSNEYVDLVTQYVKGGGKR